MSERNSNNEGDGSSSNSEGLDIPFNTVPIERVKLYSDAVWAIVATIMILPIMHMKSIEELGKHSHNYTAEAHKFEVILPTIMKKLGIYYLVFLIICNSWSGHVWTFQPLEKVTDFITHVNLIILLFAAMLPYLYSVMSAHQQPVSIVIYCVDQILIALVQIFIVIHAFNHSGLLKETLFGADIEKDDIRNRILLKLAPSPILCTMAIMVCFINVTAAFIILFIILIYSWIQSAAVHGVKRLRDFVEKKLLMRKMLVDEVLLLSERIPIDRITAFSDGVFAITGTLCILDITEKYVPTAKQVAKHGLNNVLANNGHTYAIYMTAFILIGLLWFNNTILFKSLACVGILPLSLTVTTKYKINVAGIWGLKATLLAVFCIGILQAMIYGVAWWKDRKGRINNEAWLCLSVQHGGENFWEYAFQMVSLPLSSLICFIVAFSDNFRVTAILSITFICVYATGLFIWKIFSFYLNPELKAILPRHSRWHLYGTINE